MIRLERRDAKRSAGGELAAALDRPAPGSSHRLVLVRHAEPEADARGRCYGKLDVDLSEAGRSAARTLGRVGRAWRWDALRVSPRRRTRETARALDFDAPMTLDDDLVELDFGDLEGKSYAQVEAEYPEIYAQWMCEPTRVRFPGGESHADMRARTRRFLARESTRGAPGSPCRSLVVTHGGVIRTVLAELLEMPPEALFRLHISHLGISVVDFHAGTPVVRLVNGTVS